MITHFFSHPDYTVGSGISPDQPARCAGSRTLPPVGNSKESGMLRSSFVTRPRRISFFSSLSLYALFFDYSRLFLEYSDWKILCSFRPCPIIVVNLTSCGGVDMTMNERCLAALGEEHMFVDSGHRTRFKELLDCFSSQPFFTPGLCK